MDVLHDGRDCRRFAIATINREWTLSHKAECSKSGFIPGSGVHVDVYPPECTSVSH